MITVDGTDFRVPEQPDQPTSWFSFKFRSAAVRYKVAISIFSGDIVWTNGPWRAGRYPDLSIFRQGLKQLLLSHGEVAVADKGYRGEPDCINLPDEGSPMHQYMMARARSCHETCNKRFKQFAILSSRFRANIDWHQQVFHAVVVLTQISIEEGSPLWNAMVAS